MAVSQMAVSQMAFRAQKVIGTFEKWAQFRVFIRLRKSLTDLYISVLYSRSTACRSLSAMNILLAKQELPPSLH